MEENGQKRIEIKKYLDNLRATQKYSEDVLAVVKDDLEHDVPKEKIKMYLNSNSTAGQMKIISDCIRNDAPDELIKLMQNTSFSGHHLQVIAEFFKKGVEVSAIQEIAMMQVTPVAMQKALEEVIRHKEKLEEISRDNERLNSIVKDISEAVARICAKDERCGLLIEQIASHMAEIGGGTDALIRELAERDDIINSQQNNLNSANVTIARLREDTEKKEEHNRRLEKRIENLEDRLLEMSRVVTEQAALRERDESDIMDRQEDEKDADDKYEASESKRTVSNDKHDNNESHIKDNTDVQDEADEIKEAEKVRKTEESHDMEETAYQRTNDKKWSFEGISSMWGEDAEEDKRLSVSVPMNYGRGNMVIERTSARNMPKGMLAGMFAKFCTKKKSRADIVRLLAQGELVSDQLVQIRTAIQKGLKESQLIELINNNVSADRMKEIIEIAVLENMIDG